MPDLALSVKELPSRGSLLARVLDVNVSACSHDFDKFNNISPSSSPHWPLENGKNKNKNCQRLYQSNQHTDV